MPFGESHRNPQTKNAIHIVFRGLVQSILACHFGTSGRAEEIRVADPIHLRCLPVSNFYQRRRNISMLSLLLSESPFREYNYCGESLPDRVLRTHPLEVKSTGYSVFHCLDTCGSTEEEPGILASTSIIFP
ncbi:hypothetical protein ACHAXS_011148 [Conticribra weissflogii]